MKFKMLTIGLVCTSIAATSVVMAASTGADYSKIRKDLNVMTQIITSAFKNNSACNDCKVKVSTTYLAEQGAVFTVESYQVKYAYSFSNGDHSSFSFEEFEGLDTFVIPDIPEIANLVSNILVDVGVSLEDAGAQIEIITNGHGGEKHIRIDRSNERSLRNAARELSREARDLSYQIREYEIEMLHADEKEERKQLELKIETIEREISKIDEKRDALNQKNEDARLEREKNKKSHRLKLDQEQKARLVQVQDIILQTFCDYGATLRNLPDEERVSIIFKQSKKTGNEIFVLTKDQITGCDSNSKKLKEEILSYSY